MKSVIVEEFQKAILLKNGKIIRVIGPGKHWLSLFTEVYFSNVNEPEFYSSLDRVLIKNYPDLMKEHFVLADVSDKQVGVIYCNNKLHSIIGPGQQQLFWKTLNDVTVEYINISENWEIEKEKVSTLRGKLPNTTEVLYETVNEGCIGMLYLNGEYIKQLTPGSYAFWKGQNDFFIRTVDQRLTRLEIPGQEILTKDKVSLRLNFDAYYRVINPEAAINTVKDYKEYIYNELQFALRKVLGEKTLDEILNTKENLSSQAVNLVKENANRAGVSITQAGIRDVVLPGDMREILNRVVETEKQAQANLIKRREEVAATRSLLNTAKMMENNPTLMRLKEMETLERITENVDTISVLGGLDQLMKSITK